MDHTPGQRLVSQREAKLAGITYPRQRGPGQRTMDRTPCERAFVRNGVLRFFCLSEGPMRRPNMSDRGDTCRLAIKYGDFTARQSWTTPRGRREKTSLPARRATGFFSVAEFPPTRWERPGARGLPTGDGIIMGSCGGAPNEWWCAGRSHSGKPIRLRGDLSAGGLVGTSVIRLHSLQCLLWRRCNCRTPRFFFCSADFRSGISAPIRNRHKNPQPPAEAVGIADRGEIRRSD